MIFKTLTLSALALVTTSTFAFAASHTQMDEDMALEGTQSVPDTMAGTEEDIINQNSQTENAPRRTLMGSTVDAVTNNNQTVEEAQAQVDALIMGQTGETDEAAPTRTSRPMGQSEQNPLVLETPENQTDPMQGQPQIFEDTATSVGETLQDLSASPDLSSVTAQPMAQTMDIKIVGGAEMFPTQNIVENAVNSADHTTLVAALQAAGLVDALSGTDMFTVFAPTNTAFDELPEGTVSTLLMEENIPLLKRILEAHVVSGTITAEDLMANANASENGEYEFFTLSNDSLFARVQNDTLYIVDETGQMANITISDVAQSNGMIHVVDKVLVPGD
jgi:uncharacterized surface protein with fasciclin (FAS1) repeats